MPTTSEVERRTALRAPPGRWARRACAPGRRPPSPSTSTGPKVCEALASCVAIRSSVTGRERSRRPAPTSAAADERGHDADRQRRRASARAPARWGWPRPCRSRTRRARPRRTPRRTAPRRGSRTSAPRAGRSAHSTAPATNASAERAEGQSRAALELLVHAGAALPDELAFDQVLIRHEALTLRIGAAVFPSIQGSPARRFSTPKGDATAIWNTQDAVRVQRLLTIGADSPGKRPPDGDRGPTRIRDLDNWRNESVTRKLGLLVSAFALAGSILAANCECRPRPVTARRQLRHHLAAVRTLERLGCVLPRRQRRLRVGRRLDSVRRRCGRRRQRVLLRPQQAGSFGAAAADRRDRDERPALLRSPQPRHPVLRDEPDRLRHRPRAGDRLRPARRSDDARRRHRQRRQDVGSDAPSSARRSAS